MNQRAATVPGGYYGTILGDWRRAGVYTSYQAECIARMPKGELVAVLIKAQHNTMSSTRAYPGLRLPRILHEYIVLWSRPRQVASLLADLAGLAKQQQARLSSSWKVLVRHVLVSLGGEAALAAIYGRVAENAPERLAANPNWQAKIRQVLNQHPNDFQPLERGVWRLAA